MEPDVELPRAVALAWGVAASPQRSRRRELSLERIVEAAVALADDGGLGAVSMASVASSLGYTTMSLYRYVSAKDDLIVLMNELAIGRPPEALREAADWRDGVRRWSAAEREVYREHPWLLDIPISVTPVTPNSLAWLEGILAVLAPTGLPHEERLALALAVMAQDRWHGTVERRYLEAARVSAGGAEAVGTRMAELLDALVTAETHPSLRAALDAGVFGPESGDPLTVGLERLLDGVAARLPRG